MRVSMSSMACWFNERRRVGVNDGCRRLRLGRRPTCLLFERVGSNGSVSTHRLRTGIGLVDRDIVFKVGGTIRCSKYGSRRWQQTIGRKSTVNERGETVERAKDEHVVHEWPKHMHGTSMGHGGGHKCCEDNVVLERLLCNQSSKFSLLRLSRVFAATASP